MLNPRQFGAVALTAGMVLNPTAGQAASSETSTSTSQFDPNKVYYEDAAGNRTEIRKQSKQELKQNYQKSRAKFQESRARSKSIAANSGPVDSGRGPVK
jgi:hypothetical protein